MFEKGVRSFHDVDFFALTGCTWLMFQEVFGAFMAPIFSL